jgi:type II secretory pathway component PulC
MKVTKSQKRLLIILSLTIAYAVYDFIINMDQYSKYYFTEKKTPSTLIVPKSAENLATKKLPIGQQYSWKRDPFMRIGQTEPEKKDRVTQPDIKLVLKAITKDANKSFVMINDLILKEGETVAGYRIDKIYNDKVQLIKNNKTTFLYLK